MKNIIGTGSALERLKKIIPASVQPKFTSVEEWQAWQETEGRKRSGEIDKMNQRARSEKIFGRAGIQALHRIQHGKKLRAELRRRQLRKLCVQRRAGNR